MSKPAWLKKLIFTQNDCYKTGRKIRPQGIMIHSTGANNPYLKRYVGPDDGLLGVNKYNNHWNQKMSRNVCPHAFLGLASDGELYVYQVLPWDHEGWHAGGQANKTHIGIEICEGSLTDKKYFAKVYELLCEFCAYICREFNLPTTSIIDHAEGRKLGIASNHADVGHWFPKHGKSFASVRVDTQKLLDKEPATPTPKEPTDKAWVVLEQHGYFHDKSNAERLTATLRKKGKLVYIQEVERRV